MGLVDIGVTVRSVQDNPWLDRLVASFQFIHAGLRADVLVEEGPAFTKVEKRMRLLRRSAADFLCVMEDDAEVVQEGWLLALVDAAAANPQFALVSPQETRSPVPEEGRLAPELRELAYTPGFCFLLNRRAGLEWDVRVQTLDDLHLSLLARSRGWRLGLAMASIVRHSKEPFARDDTPPWEQDDRSRFGPDAAYYQREAHDAARTREARWLVERFGPLALGALPKELSQAIGLLEPAGSAALEERRGRDGTAKQR